MTEHKFTDEEVIKALETHTDLDTPCYGRCVYENERRCGSRMAKDALDLIKRQKEEIDDLKDKNEHLVCIALEARAEAVKEYAERLKERLIAGGIYPVLVKNQIEELSKEMIEEYGI